MAELIVTLEGVATTDEWVILGSADIYDVWIKEQMLTRTKGYETLEFKIPLNNPKARFIQSERIINVAGERRYRIRNIVRSRMTTQVMSVYCEALWYDLNNGVWTVRQNGLQQTARALINLIASPQGDGFLAGTIDGTSTRSYTLNDAKSPLYHLRYIQKIFGQEMYFDTINKTINLVDMQGVDTEIVLNYTSNLEQIERKDDTTQLITRFYLYGADGIDISSINGGRDYVENYDWYDAQGMPRKIKAKRVEDERFSVLENMYEYMVDYINVYSKPLITYEIGHPVVNRVLNIGDRVRVIDSELLHSEQYRVVERSVNVQYIEESTYIFNNPLDTLVDDQDLDDFVG